LLTGSASPVLRFLEKVRQFGGLFLFRHATCCVN
jgi:hypothetical protein